MDNISVYVGRQIKFFRKLNSLSIGELADLVHKSKSTLSKYENGLITIDIQTLEDICCALHVDIREMFTYKKPEEQSALFAHNRIFSRNKLYIYYYDGRKKSIVKSYMTIQNNNSQNVVSCTFYMDIPSFEECDQCAFYYIGKMDPFDLVTYCTLINQVNPMERLGMCFLNPFHHNVKTWGIMFGISYRPIAPFALKFLLSTAPLNENELLEENLMITQDEIKIMKQMNMMLLNQ